MYYFKRLKTIINASIKLLLHFIGSILIKPFIGKPDFQKLDLQKPYRILYVCLAFRGDLVINFPAIVALKKHFPNSRLTCWVREYNESLVRLNPVIDEVITYGDVGRSTISLVLEFLRGTGHSPFLERLKDFDLYLDDSGYTYSALAGFRSKIPYRIGRNFQGFGFLYHQEFPLDQNMQLIERRLKLLRPLGIKLSLNDIAKPYFQIDQEKIAQVRNELGIPPKDYITVQPFAGWEAKNWGIDKYCSVVRKFSDLTGLLPVFIGSKLERPLIEESFTRHGLKAINLAGIAGLDQSAAVIAGARFHFGGDSIGMQLAIALGIKGLSIFGPANPYLCAYLGKANIGVRKITRCTPKPDKIYCCFDAGRSCRHLSCMTELRQDDVFNTLMRHWSGEKLPAVVEF